LPEKSESDIFSEMDTVENMYVSTQTEAPDLSGGNGQRIVSALVGSVVVLDA
jgi:hypothetical protein